MLSNKQCVILVCKANRSNGNTYTSDCTNLSKETRFQRYKFPSSKIAIRNSKVFGRKFSVFNVR